MRHTFFSFILSFSLSMGVEAQEIIKPDLKSATSFAIIIDKASYAKTKSAVENYRRSIEDDGLGTYIAIDDWDSPEKIRHLLMEWHADRRQPLEGAVFVGDIPIPMIRDAQYLTSAFKMNQKRPWQASSVPSDRYYDDFSLQFRFIKRDADRSDLFYYSLSPESAHTIAPDIYTARIRPPKRQGTDRYQLLADYLEKVAKIKAEEAHGNLLDNLTMARGHGYNSEDPNAWAGEQLALREQMPELFRPGATAKFMSFEMYYPVRKLYVNEICRDNLDVMLFHHHGAPDTQYFNGYPECSAIDPSIANVKRFLRSKIGRYAHKANRDSIVAVYAQRYDVPEKWCREAFDADLRVKDSIFNAEMDLHLEDLLHIHPNARFVWFDACYNGSFHEEDCIADAYIFNSGKTVATMGNTVNSLQDKWPDEFVGLLSSGMRLGQFNRHTAYLETHLIGDPTYRFKCNSGVAFDINAALTLHDKDVKFWLKQLKNPIADVQAMALRQLYLARYSKAADVMENAYFTSDNYVVRLEALKMLALHYPESSIRVLKAALNDNYEQCPSATYCQPEVASVGLTQEKAEELGYKVAVGKFPLAALGKANISGHTDGFVKIVAEAESKKVLGLHIIGEHACDLIAEGALALHKVASLEDIASTIHPHPSLSESVAEAAHHALGMPINFFPAPASRRPTRQNQSTFLHRKSNLL